MFYDFKMNLRQMAALCDIASRHAGASPADDWRTRAALARRGLVPGRDERALTPKGKIYLEIALYEMYGSAGRKRRHLRAVSS
jgi:hypothetical protein